MNARPTLRARSTCTASRGAHPPRPAPLEHPAQTAPSNPALPAPPEGAVPTQGRS